MCSIGQPWPGRVVTLRSAMSEAYTELEMSQLTLPVGLEDHARFESFYTGPNAEVVDLLEQMSRGQGEPVCWIWGGQGSGRSHLLQACVARCQQIRGRPIYLPLSDASLEAAILQDISSMDLICLDDVDHTAGTGPWERALFQLYEGVRSSGSRLVMTASGPPADVGFQLADLASRMNAAPVYRLRSMADEDRIQALILRAKLRGLELPTETARFLMARVSRDQVSLFQLLDRLDTASLASGRRLTIPFVRQTLESEV